MGTGLSETNGAPIFIHSDDAQYRFERVVQSFTLTFPISFAKENGQWKILDY